MSAWLTVALVIAGLGTVLAIILVFRLSAQLAPTVNELSRLGRELAPEIQGLREDQAAMERRLEEIRLPRQKTGPR
ncbi:MAG: hypothetical protein R3A49_02795 [Acidimicrobiia bacterium]